MTELEMEVETPIFEKGSFVFGICKNELPWPAKITKIIRDNYTVKFVNHRSVAVLNTDCLLPFNDRNIVKVMDEYKSNNKPNDKVFNAIKACKNELEAFRKKEEKEYLAANKMAKKMTAQTELTHSVQSSQFSTRTRRQEKKVSKSLKKLAKIQQPSPIPIKGNEDDQLVNQYVLMEPQNKPMPQNLQSLKTLMEEINIETNQNAEELSYVSSYQEEETEPKQLAIPQKMPEKTEEIHQNEPVSHQQPIIESMVSPSQSIEPIATNESNIHTSAIDQANRTENCMEAEFSPEENERVAIEHINSFLTKMIDFLTGTTRIPLSREEKMEFGILLQNHRKLYYDHHLLENMIGFVKAFDLRLKEERKACIIEYIKVKERVETACFLRSELCYDQKTQEILDKYSPREDGNQ